jgi:DNA polymerase-1
MSKELYRICKNMTQVSWLIEKLNQQEEWAFDTETHGTFLDGYIFIISFSWKEGVGIAIDFTLFNEEDQEVIWNNLRSVFLNKSRKITQNGVYDIKFLWKKGIAVRNWYADTMLEDHLLDENRPHGLEQLAHRYSTMGGYHDEFDRYLDEHPECNPQKAQLSDFSWKDKDSAIEDGDKIIGYGTFLNFPKDLIHPYACRDADVTLRCHRAMMPLIKKEGVDWVLFNVQMPIQKVLAEVEYHGVSIDLHQNDVLREDYLSQMKEVWSSIVDSEQVQRVISSNKQKFIDKYNTSKLLRKKYTLTQFLEREKDKWDFKLSPQQLTKLIIGEFKMEPLAFGRKKNKKTGEFNVSMNADVLTEYAKTLPIAKKILDYRQLMFLNGTFIEGLRNFVCSDGRVRSNYPLHRTVTGRPSSLQPNLNNIPRKKVELKHQFVADKGDYLVEADYSQIEFRIWAHYCQDPQMIADINAGLDIHKITAAMGKGLVIPSGNITYEQFLEWTKDVTKEERNVAKTVVFGMMYGRGPKSIAAELNISVGKARNIIRLFFNRYSTAESWLISAKNEAAKVGYVKNLYGRKRRLPILLNAQKQLDDIKNAYEQQIIDIARGVSIPEDQILTQEWVNEERQRIMGLRAKADRQAINSPIQSGASDTTFLAAIRIQKEIKRLKLKSRMVLTVYDSLIYNVKPDELETMLRLIRTEMLRDTGQVRVVLNCEIKVGYTWGKLEEVQFDDDYNPKMDCIEILKST